MQERGYQDEDRQNRRDFSDRDRSRRDFDDRNFGRNDRMNRGDLDRWGDQSDQGMYSGRSYDRDEDNRNLGGYGSSIGSQQRFAPFDRDRGLSGRNLSGSYGNQSSFEGQQSYRDFERDDRQRSRQQSMGPHAGRGPKGYQRSDERIKEDVCDCLTRDPQVDASEIEVQVKDGEVTLTGTVSERNEKRRAEDALDDVLGVKEIHNQIRVQAHHQESGERNIQGQSQQGKQQSASQKGSQF
ncbi:MAG TPA: BON domain-containing protein [Oligoflexus sp.]|uniref:BON domain-containing protein n=1 Tax=Oligoflexus sp. TaxID=1971216 RepID=UPI002D7EDEF7|nr:BON domain-containing protein [Oligoflexus sp.]HET9236651.1 BON domain-containing protein [Oligoflexus sp.]